jgi:ADP-L-glycero-D-manno-heptose 6-epimerase
MILVTGGAGVIGSNLQAALVLRGIETIVADSLGCKGKWRNLAAHPPDRIIPPCALDQFLETQPPLEMVFHLGAVSSTSAVDGNHTWNTNVELSRRLWTWCAAHGIRFVYASSAATYGDGTQGFDDAGGYAELKKLRPMNLYGWSKHAFDLWALREAAKGHAPPFWAGLKFFNVFGPNEYHKDDMMSLVAKSYAKVAAGEAIRLFKSHRPGIADGDQKRDFVYVKDCADAVLWLWRQGRDSGIYNIGTGAARSFRELMEATGTACGTPPKIEYVDTPPAIRSSYQYLTEARLSHLRAAGYNAPFTSLEDAVNDFVTGYLATPDPYL